jgi:hypothetical protein
MLVAARPLLGIATKTIGEGLASGTSSQAQALGQHIVESYRYVDRHVCNVARCMQVPPQNRITRIEAVARDLGRLVAEAGEELGPPGAAQ